MFQYELVTEQESKEETLVKDSIWYVCIPTLTLLR